jgi:hypothetical protein
VPRGARVHRVVEDSTAAFSGTRARGRQPGNLPLELSSFIGRGQEIAEIKRLLEDSRLLTLAGPGGCGKTWLALAVASEVPQNFGDGVWWVELAPLADPDLVPQEVASELGVREAPGRTPIEVLIEHLKIRGCSWYWTTASTS